jgi:hypothetical protein
MVFKICPNTANEERKLDMVFTKNTDSEPFAVLIF